MTTSPPSPPQPQSRHLPSCHTSRHWRGEPADFSVIPTSTTNSTLLQEYGFHQPTYCWYATLTVEQTESLQKRMVKEDGELRPMCGCYNPTLSESENDEWREEKEKEELREGWKAGKPWQNA